MKKLFTFFAAALVALAVNAAPLEPGTDVLSAAITAAEAGATIELNSGEFTESGTLSISKNITIKAVDLKNKPLLKEGGIISISGDVRVKFIGIDIKADGSHDAFDISAAEALELDSCEIFNLAERRAIKVGGTAHADTLRINNCYFHNGTSYSVIEVESNSSRNGCNSLEIKNSTFANFNIGDKAIISFNSKGSAKAADPADDANLVVDHCTFYNFSKTSSSSTWGCIDFRKSTKAMISNCIFANPATLPEGSYAQKATQMYGGIVSNCLLFNTPNHRTDDITINGALKDVDPKFIADSLAIGKYNLADDSPAKAAGVGGTHLGDPRWWPASWAPAEVIPVISVALDKNALTLDVNETAFLHATVLPDNASDPFVTWSSNNNSVATVSNGVVKGIAAGTAKIIAKAGEKTDTCEVTVSDVIPSTNLSESYFLKGTKAKLEGNIDVNEADSLHYTGKSAPGTATWKINATRGCVIGATANFKTSSASGAKLRIVILDEDENQVGDSLMQEYYEHGGDKAFTGTIALPKEGVYTIKLVNVQKWSSSKLNGITLTYVSDLPITLYLKAGVWNAAGAKFGVYVKEEGWWPEFMTQVGETDIYTIQIPANKRSLNFVRFANTKEAPGEGDIWNQVVDLTRENDNNCLKITGWGNDGYSTGEWRKYFPDLEAGYYLAGTFNSWEPTPADKFASLNESEYTIEADLADGDRFKAISLDADKLLTGWYPSGTGNEYVVTEWTAGEKTIYFRPTYHDAWSGHFYIAPNAPTVTYSNFEIDLRDGQLGTDKSNPNNKYLAIDGENYTYTDDMPIAYNAYLATAKYNGNQHGYENLVVTMPVEAGNHYKVTLGTCEYGNGAGSIKKADESVTYKTFDQKTAACYDANPATNVVSTVFYVAEAQTVKIVCGNYTPYIKVEQVANLEYFVRFEVGEDVRGIVPSPVYIPAGDSYTIPAKRTLYKDGYTFTGWTDGVNTYAPGQNFTPEDDATLTAVFAENTANLLTATVPVTVQWNFGQTEGAPAVAWQGETKGMGFLVAQATIGTATVDVLLDIDARHGKFDNCTSRNDEWAQVNATTKLSFPAKKDAVVEVYTYADPATSNLDGNTKTGDWTGNKAIFHTTKDTDSSIFTAKDEGQYYRYLKVTYPASEATSISNTEAGEKAQKMIENGQIVIIKNGVKYNVLGVSLK